MLKVAIIGTTAWGITIGVLLARKGLQVRLWARTEKEATKLRNARPNADLLSGIDLPPEVSITDQLSEALADVKDRKSVV